MTGRLAVLAMLAMLAPAFAQDKPKPKFEKVPPKTITLHLDASKLPPDVLAALMKLAEAQKSAETKKGAGEKPGGKKGEPVKPGTKGEKPGGKKGEPVKPGTKGEFSKKPAPAAPTSLGHAVMLLEKKGQTVVKAEAVGGVFVLQLADGSTMKLEAATKGGKDEKGGKGGGEKGGKGGGEKGGKGIKGEEPKKK